MKTEMKFSVITISFNAADVIEKTIKSVMRQDYHDYEYIFVDGASKDETNKIIELHKEPLAKLGIPVTHISEPDRGISDGFAKGVRLARGEIVVILNAADEMLPGTLAFLAKEFDEKTDVLYGNIIWHDDQRGLEYIKKSKPPERLDELKYTMVVKHPATYIKRSAYEKYGNYNPEFKYAMDTELLLRMYRQGAIFKYVDREFTYFQAGGASDTHLIDGMKETARIAKAAGESDLKIAVCLSYKFIRHKLAHFIRFNFMKGKIK